MASPAMTAKDMLLTKEEAQAVGAKWNQWDEILALRQVRKTLEALRPIVEATANERCYHPLRLPLSRDTYRYEDCGQCSPCRARAVLAEMNAQGKGKEG